MRHDGRAEDADREQHAPRCCRTAGMTACLNTWSAVGMRERELGDVAGADHADERRDHRFERADAEALQPEDRERGDAGRARPTGRAPMPMSRWMPIAAPRNSARSVAIAIASACTQSRNDARRENSLAADLRQVAARRDAELRRQRLDQHREQVRGDDHPDQPVAEARAAGDVGREVARDRCRRRTR